MTFAGRRWSLVLSLLAFAMALFAPQAGACDSSECKRKEKKARAELREPAAAKGRVAYSVPGMKSPVSLQPSWYTDPAALSAPTRGSETAKALPVKATEAPTP